MDYSFTHCDPLPRAFPTPWPVSSIGYVPRKGDWVHRRFATCNFSFILSGGGIYRKAGAEWAVRSPCVITQWPGELVEYGPQPEGRTWEELFLIYPASTMRVFRASRLVDASRPIWEIRNTAAVDEVLTNLRELLGQTSQAGAADRIDRVCERLVVESLLGANSSDSPSDVRPLQDLRRRMELRPAQTVDWASEARAVGMSESTFRRRWLEAFGVPPGQTLQEARIRRARRLLAETRRPVKDIATECGFDDPLYFSRRFRELTGSSARAYRRTHSASQIA
ncbi:MAG: AraC family transcriptional regulator [Terrimicrobiaceae bacterium]|nr:AraC family transcriptional regulator [Terrimicrobiaceae bacterium]